MAKGKREISSRLLDLTVISLAGDGKLDAYSDHVEGLAALVAARGGFQHKF